MKRFIVTADGAEVTNNGDMVNAPTQWMFQGENIEVSDGFHTMHDLYEHRMALNIALFNNWQKFWQIVDELNMSVIDLENAAPRVCKAKLHADGTMFEGYFIVMAQTKIGQISYHYKLKHWDLFKIPEVPRTPPYDCHSPEDVIHRLVNLI